MVMGVQIIRSTNEGEATFMIVPITMNPAAP
jgi:hypothetical protein